MKSQHSAILHNLLLIVFFESFLAAPCLGPDPVDKGLIFIFFVFSVLNGSQNSSRINDHTTYKGEANQALTVLPEFMLSHYFIYAV